MKNTLVKIFLGIALSWCILSILYLVAGLLVVLHSENEVASIIKAYGVSDWTGAIAGMFSAIAAFMSFHSAERSAKAAENANVTARLLDRLRTKYALSVIWNFLNSKSCIRAMSSDHPETFLISEAEMENIRKEWEVILSSSAAYGKDFHGKLSGFMVSLVPELQAQTFFCDFDTERGGDVD